MLKKPDQPVSTQLVKETSNIHIENPPHFLPVDRDTQRIQRIVLAAFWSEAIRESEEILLVGRDEPRGGSPLRSRAVVWLFRASALTEGAWPLVLVPPLRTHRADFPQWAPQSAFANHVPLDRRVKRACRWPWQLEPVAGLQKAPMELMPLALPA